MRESERISKRDRMMLAALDALPEAERRCLEDKFNEWARRASAKLPGVELSLAKCKAAFLAKELLDKGKNREKI